MSRFREMSVRSEIRRIKLFLTDRYFAKENFLFRKLIFQKKKKQFEDESKKEREKKAR